MSSIGKALKIIDRLSDPPYQMSLTDLSKYFNLGKSGLLKILSELEQNGLVCRDPFSKQYSVGTVFLRIGTLYGSKIKLHDTITPILEMVTNMTGETSYFGMKDGINAFMAYKHEGRYNFPYSRTLGKKLNINASSAGKIITAYREPEEINYLLKTQELQKWTNFTKTDLSSLLEEYQKIRKQGFSIADEEYHVGFIGISLPIFGKNKNFFGCLTIVGSKERLTPGKIPEWIAVMKNGADSLSDELQMIL